MARENSLHRMTFNRKLDKQNCLFRLPPRIHPMDPLNLYYMRLGEAYLQSITQPWWLKLVSNLTRDGGIKKGHCILTGRENCEASCLHITAKRSVGKWLQKCLNQILLPWVHDCRIDRQHPAILEESPQVLFGVITAMTSPRSWEDIIQSHEVRFLAHEAWNGLLKESVEKDRFVASDKKKKASGA